jgi:hypothetical protein
MSQGERQRGQVKAAVQELGRAASAEAVSADAHSRATGVCDQLGSEAREVTSGQRLEQVGRAVRGAQSLGPKYGRQWTRKPRWYSGRARAWISSGQVDSAAR